MEKEAEEVLKNWFKNSEYEIIYNWFVGRTHYVVVFVKGESEREIYCVRIFEVGRCWYIFQDKRCTI